MQICSGLDFGLYTHFLHVAHTEGLGALTFVLKNIKEHTHWFIMKNKIRVVDSSFNCGHFPVRNEAKNKNEIKLCVLHLKCNFTFKAAI